MKHGKVFGVVAVALALGCTETSDPAGPSGAQLPKPSFLSVTGAAFTTTNTEDPPDGDGTGHCKNGNEAINCNIYDGKEFVWLNGGPSVAYVGDGQYFFAVLAPGGQPSPNDAGSTPDDGTGTPKNLSDDFDAYTNRTFSVAGGVVSYSGGHDFNHNKIRLADYSDTPNPGGVYIMAICSLGAGYPVTPSKCKYDAFKVRTEGGQEQEADAPTILKDAAGENKNTFTWDIDKAADKTEFEQIGGSITANYTVTVTHDGGTISDVKVSGKISVFNPNVDASNNTVSLHITGVTDQLSDNTVCTVTSGGAQTLTDFQTDFNYSCDLGSDLPSGALDNTATVSWDAQTINGASLAAGSTDFTFTSIVFTETLVDDEVTVTDTYGNTTLGTVKSTDASPTEFKYSRVIGVLSGCHDYDNTATFTTNTTSTTGSDDETVTVCGPAATGALTMGFWKGPNGNSLIANYCAPSGKTSLAAYLSGLGSGAGPFSDAAGKTCSQLVTYVNAIFKAASATNMNNMLKPQMLATALDVYFSSATLGYSATPKSTKIKPPSNFLPNVPIGGFVMDLTSVCPMVDNLSTGTATCKNATPSTNAFTAGAVPWASQAVQGILDFGATVPPFNGSTSNSIWYAGNRTKQEILKNIYDQINNQDAFAP